jgi:predicted GIY-YIG superfamily endonuclease
MTKLFDAKGPMRLIWSKQCDSWIEFADFESHIKEDHNGRMNDTASNYNTRKNLTDSGALTKEKLVRTENWVKSWLRRKKNHLYSNRNNSTILTIATLEKFMGYEFYEIARLYGGIRIKFYEAGIKKLYSTYEQMIAESARFLVLYSKNYIQKSIDQYNVDDERSGTYVSWYSLNSVDPIDGHKYIGYLGREYKDSRFGSYPLHDDYGDESWADADPWE